MSLVGRKRKALAGLALAGSLYFGVDSYGGLQRADETLKNDPHYATVMKLDDARAKVNSAIHALGYAKPETELLPDYTVHMVFPVQRPEKLSDSVSAKNLIASAVSSMGYEKGISESLESIYHALPDSPPGRSYSFAPEIRRLGNVAHNLAARRRQYLDNVPDSLFRQKDREAAKVGASMLGALASMAAALNASANTKKRNKRRRY